jgi:phage tail-like protein
MSDTGYYDESTTTATFLVEVDGQTVGRFIEVSGLEVSIEVMEHEEGGENFFVHKLPGRITWPNLVLKRGITQSNNLIGWIDKSAAGGFEAEGNKLTRSTMAVTLMSAAGARLRSWNFEGAFPVKWVGPSFAMSSDDPPMEELEIAHHGFSVDG